jgi:hypothetical protein
MNLSCAGEGPESLAAGDNAREALTREQSHNIGVAAKD